MTLPTQLPAHNGQLSEDLHLRHVHTHVLKTPTILYMTQIALSPGSSPHTRMHAHMHTLAHTLIAWWRFLLVQRSMQYTFARGRAEKTKTEDLFCDITCFQRKYEHVHVHVQCTCLYMYMCTCRFCIQSLHVHVCIHQVPSWVACYRIIWWEYMYFRLRLDHRIYIIMAVT